jgi:hypothetical protein
LSQVDRTLLINNLLMLVGASWQINLRTGNMKKAARISFNKLTGLLAVHDVVGNGGDFFYVLGKRAYGPKWMQGSHKELKLSNGEQSIILSIQASIGRRTLETPPARSL